MTAHVRQMDRYGCAIACCAMVRGVSYAKVAETFGPPDRGFTHDVWQQYLALYGFAAQHLFSYDPMAGKSRSPWPLEPWAPLHLCSVDAGCGFGSHLVVLRDDGVVLDPAADAPRRLADYASVNFMVGIFRVGVQPGGSGHLAPTSRPDGTGGVDRP